MSDKNNLFSILQVVQYVSIWNKYRIKNRTESIEFKPGRWNPEPVQILYHRYKVKVGSAVSVSEFNEFKPRLKSPKTGFNWAPAQILKILIQI